MRFWIVPALGVVGLSLLTGCSVGMALHGADNPDLSVLRHGAHRSVVEVELGRPKEWFAEDRRARYFYTTGEEGSPGRAMGHAAADVLTFGLWEIIGTPIEATQQHDQWEIDIWYSQRETVDQWAGPRRRGVYSSPDRAEAERGRFYD